MVAHPTPDRGVGSSSLSDLTLAGIATHFICLLPFLMQDHLTWFDPKIVADSTATLVHLFTLSINNIHDLQPRA